MNLYRTEFIGYPVDNVSILDIENICLNCIKENSYNYIAVQNANKMYLSNKYSLLNEFMLNAKIILPENAVNIGMSWLKKPLKERNIGGIHVMENLLDLAEMSRSSVFFLGASQNNLEILINKIKIKYPNIIVKGYNNGYFSPDEEQEIVNTIGNLRPNYLFVGIGSPKQEFFIMKNLDNLKTNICIGVGGSFNVIAGLEKPAPKWTKYGLEWLFRSFQDPKKFKRYLIINTFFIFIFIKYIFGKK